MTVLPKPSLVIKKVPLRPEDICDEEAEIQAYTPSIKTQKPLVCSLVVLLAALLAVGMVAMMFLRQGKGVYEARFQGFCAVPVPPKSYARDSLMVNVLPLTWSGQDVQIFSTFDDTTGDEMVNSLREELDIGDVIEKITVIDNGRRVDFVHDFDVNVTSIADDERCFTMDLEPEATLAPSLFAVSLQKGDQFDVSRIRSQMQATIPPLPSFDRLARALLIRCAGKPLYELITNFATIKRKRSVDEPAHDYIQFAGKHIQEIEVNNLADILQYEQNLNNKTA